MRTIHLLAALPLTGLFAGQAFAQACNKPLTLTNEIQMESTAGGPSSIPVKINGADQNLTLATAGTTTQLSEDAAKALNLEIERGDVTLTDERGNVSRNQVTIADFSMGRLHGTNVKWPISPGNGKGGLFSLNYMRLYDVDVDFGNDKLRLFSQDHCPGAVLYWKAPGAVGTVPITIDNGRVTVPVMVDGKAITGVIDTASAGSSVYAAIAEKVLGIDTSNTKSLTAKTVGIGQLTLNDVSFMVRPDINSQGSGDRARDLRVKKTGIDFEMAHPEVNLGMDVLRKLHLYMAFGENKLYVTGTTGTPPAAAAKTP